VIGFGLTFHHLGLAVSRPEGAEKFLAALGYQLGTRIRDDVQRVNLAMATHEAMPAVEIIWPTEIEGPLTSLLKLSAEIAYHLAYQCDRIEDAVSAIKSAGHRLLPVSPPQPAVLFGGRMVSFQRVSGFGLIELVERTLRSETPA
jgi:Glyoxalase/Bleomycin resistance protein/Dioxygenase superfamily